MSSTRSSSGLPAKSCKARRPMSLTRNRSTSMLFFSHGSYILSSCWMASIWRRTNAASLLLAMAHNVWRIPVAWVSPRTYLEWRLGHQHTVLSPCQERRKERPDYVPPAV